MAARGKRMSTQQKMTVVERETMVLELAKAGRTFRQIATDVGYENPGSAYKAFQRALQKTIQPVADEYRALHLARHEHIIRVHWKSMNQGDPVAASIILKALAAIATLLGLNAPKEIKIAHELAAMAGRIADDLNLNADDVLAEAERILTASGTVD